MKVMHLRPLREHRGLTQQQLAQLSGVAQNTISKLEGNPNARPVFATVVAIAAALHVDPQRIRFGPAPGAGTVLPRTRRSSKEEVSL